ncbi:transglycosylase [Staphylococcus caeli]|uniref:aggregation-promoting factor C-terminal-like domain-containing protein n=1 Tax=Staphylococcus caeli TaxID=2201815 RepID=UPI003F56BD8B
MKKSILASSLAVALGVTGYVATADNNEAHASESNVDYAHLADLAQNNPEALNEKPLHAGAYNYDFVYNGFEYNFTSNGQTWSWNYQATGAQNSIQDVAAQASTNTNETSANEVATQQQSSNTEVAPVEAPKASSNSNVQTAQTSAAAQTYKTAQASAASTGGSVKSQFLAAGGTEAMWNSIVMPESGGNPNAVNPAGYSGLGQTMESWGTGSVSSQTKGMLNYAQNRYGSIDAAIAFRASHGWW